MPTPATGAVANTFTPSLLLTASAMRGQRRQPPASPSLPTLQRSKRAKKIAAAAAGKPLAPAYPTRRSGLADIAGGAIELCAGIGTMSAALQHHGLRVAVCSETDATAASVIKALFPAATVVGDARTADFAAACGASQVRLIAAGTPCQPVAYNGQQRGLEDERASLTTEVPFAVAARSNAHIVLLENSDGIATCRNGEVLRLADLNARAVAMTRVRSSDPAAPLGLETFNVAAHGGPVTRNRGGLHYEADWIAGAVGPCWPLPTHTHDLVRICDIMITADEIATSAIIDGALTLCPAKTDAEVRAATTPTRAATLSTGGPGAPISPRKQTLKSHLCSNL